jgi:hypothetical protein
VRTAEFDKRTYVHMCSKLLHSQQAPNYMYTPFISLLSFNSFIFHFLFSILGCLLFFRFIHLLNRYFFPFFTVSCRPKWDYPRVSTTVVFSSFAFVTRVVLLKKKSTENGSDRNTSIQWKYCIITQTSSDSFSFVFTGGNCFFPLYALGTTDMLRWRQPSA